MGRLFNWKGIAVVLLVLTAVIGVCALDLRCSGAPGQHSDLARVKGELTAGKKEWRYQEAEKLAAWARDLRTLAQEYKAKGEVRKAHRAIGAAQELDRKIKKLREEAQ